MRTPVPEYMADIVEMYRDHDGGVVADYIPELAAVDPTPLAVALCTPDGVVYAGGDCDHTFSIQSMSKPFAYALAMEEHGIDYVLSYVGVEPSGDPFNDISLDPGDGVPTQPHDQYWRDYHPCADWAAGYFPTGAGRDHAC